MKAMLVVCSNVLIMVCGPALGDDLARDFREELDEMRSGVAQTFRKLPVVRDPSGFDMLRMDECYRGFATFVTGRQDVVFAHLGSLATNNWERLVTLGVCKAFDEDWYLRSCAQVADMVNSGVASSNELEWVLSSSRTNIDTCIVRRYKETPVTNLVFKLRGLVATDAYWDEVLSGVAYTNLLEEAGLDLY